MSSSSEWVVLAHVLRPQGRRGEVLAELLTDFPERLAGRENLYLAREAFTGPGEQARACEVLASWLPKGRNEGRVVLEIAGIDSIEGAERIAGWDLLVAREHRVALEDGAAYVSDLVGCAVMDRGRRVGEVRAVEFPVSAEGRRRLEEAIPLLVVELADGGEAIIPFAKQFLREFDPGGGVLQMELPEGLLELAKPGGEPGDEDAREGSEAER